MVLSSHQQQETQERVAIQILKRDIQNGSQMTHSAFASELTDEVLRTFEGQLTDRSRKSLSGLVRIGRGGVRWFELPSGRKIVMRAGARGGAIKVLKKFYFKGFGTPVLKLRPFLELEILKKLYEEGVSVPEPVSAHVRLCCAGLYYKSFLATSAIENSCNLLSAGYEAITSEQKDLFFQNCFLAGLEARKMLDARVYHPDLHLGNVLYTDEKVYLIDFDRAEIIADKSEVEDRVHRTFARWSRSAAKHNLGDLAIDAFRKGIFGMWSNKVAGK